MKPRLGRIRKHPGLSGKKEYKEKLEDLQFRMLKLQRKMHREELRAVVVFQGWDAAGKGGAIRRLVERLDPRGCRVYSIGAPRPDEQALHYLWRFWQRLPSPGQLAIFDRSWYGRVLVERVEKFARKRVWRRAYREINEFERLLVDDGCPVVKFFLHITKAEQLKRFREREASPWKRWKLTEEDWRNREKWKKYEKAVDGMFEETHTREAPWHLIAANQKWYARTEVLRIVVETLEEAF